MTARQPTPAARDIVVKAIARGLSFQGRRVTHQAEDLMALIAAERLTDHLASQNLVVVQNSPVTESVVAPAARISGERGS